MIYLHAYRIFVGWFLLGYSFYKYLLWTYGTQWNPFVADIAYFIFRLFQMSYFTAIELYISGLVQVSEVSPLR